MTSNNVGRLLFLAVMSSLIIGLYVPKTTNAQSMGDERRFFPETGITVKGAFLGYWTRRGDIKIFGNPISQEFTEVFPDGSEFLVQYFERARFEYHPENKPPNDVLLARLGLWEATSYIVRNYPEFADTANTHQGTYYPETHHNLSNTHIEEYWKRHGGLAVFGFPISEPFQLELADGKTHLVQYFERNRLEIHTENTYPFDILLGQLGREYIQVHYPYGTPND